MDPSVGGGASAGPYLPACLPACCTYASPWPHLSLCPPPSLPQRADSYDFDPMDVTKTWPEDVFPLQARPPPPPLPSCLPAPHPGPARVPRAPTVPASPAPSSPSPASVPHSPSPACPCLPACLPAARGAHGAQPQPRQLLQRKRAAGLLPRPHRAGWVFVFSTAVAGTALIEAAEQRARLVPAGERTRRHPHTWLLPAHRITRSPPRLPAPPFPPSPCRHRLQRRQAAADPHLFLPGHAAPPPGRQLPAAPRQRAQVRPPQQPPRRRHELHAAHRGGAPAARWAGQDGVSGRAGLGDGRGARSACLAGSILLAGPAHLPSPSPALTLSSPCLPVLSTRLPQVNYFPSRFDPARHAEQYPIVSRPLAGRRERGECGLAAGEACLQPPSGAQAGARLPRCLACRCLVSLPTPIP